MKNIMLLLISMICTKTPFCEGALSLIETQRYLEQNYLEAHAYNYVTFELFLNLADHACINIIEQTPFNPEDVMYADIVFVQESLVNFFIENHHPKIKNNYILLIQVSGFDSPCQYLPPLLEDPKVLRIFSADVDKCSHPKITPLPLGIWPYTFFHIGARRRPSLRNDEANWKRYIQNMNEFRSRSWEKKHLSYLNISVERNSIRGHWFNYLSDKPFCHTVKGLISNQEFLENVARSHFVFSPPGDAFDCYRTWEALYLGSIPIVLSSALDSLYEGLPVIIIKNIEDVNEKFLLEKLDEFSKREFIFSKLDPEYWRKLILSSKSGYQSFRSM